MKASIHTVLNLLNKNKRVRKNKIVYGCVCQYNYSLKKRVTYASLKVYKEFSHLKSKEEIEEEETNNKEEFSSRKVSEISRQTIRSFQTNKINDAISYFFNELDEWEKPMNQRDFSKTVPITDESSILIIEDYEENIAWDRIRHMREMRNNRKVNKNNNHVIKE